MRKKPLPEFPERKRKWPGKKDTNKWCRGVVGREHKFKTVPWPQATSTNYVIDQCQVCGKQPVSTLKWRR